MDDLFETLPRHTCSWIKALSIPTKGKGAYYKYEGFWNFRILLEGAILAQRTFKAQPSDVFLCSSPKAGTTWLKALAFAIVTRKQFDAASSPLLTTFPHDCVHYLESGLEQINENHKNSDFPLVATHLPYASLPKSVVDSDCKIVYIYRNIKDVLVSHYCYMIEVAKLQVEDVPFEVVFDEFCQGISWYGPYWDHILGYWKASQERPGRILFLKYEDMKMDTTSNVKRLAEFIGYPFSIEEEKTGMVESIIKLCSFDNLSNLEVNKNGNYRPEKIGAVANRHLFRKGKDGDWKNYFTDEMEKKMNKLVDEKLIGIDLVLK
uniref:flavonol sulfotransferase-like n=1 Tax=Erigeron canadensis TaxID=72917 RepID=UPI001CB92A7C|nr:flavonol sulfotransferase-like [Erigeron canadensis]